MRTSADDNSNNFMSYAMRTRQKEPDKMVAKAINLIETSVPHKNCRALDLGAGALNETRMLLDAGFMVDAVDKDLVSVQIGKDIHNPHLSVSQLDISSFYIQRNYYSIILAINVLPFLKRGELNALVPKLINGLIPGGILCVTLFGTKDDWSVRHEMSFHTHEEVLFTFKNLRCLLLEEVERDKPDILGRMKHWHIFKCIFKRELATT